jgi:hypothetical protein
MSVLVTGVYSVVLPQLEIPVELRQPLRRADDFIRLGVVAAYNAITAVKAAGSLCHDTTGLFLGTAFGPMGTNFEVLDQVVTAQPVSPILFSHSVFNAAAGYVASVFGMKGSAMTLTDFGFPFYRALEQGYLAVAGGRLSSCLVLQVETYSELLHDARKEHTAGAVRWQPGAVCWLLQKSEGREDTTYRLTAPAIESRKKTHEMCLSIKEEMRVGGKTVTHFDPLGGAAFLTKKIAAEGTGDGIECTVTSAYGTVELRLRIND